MKTIKQKPIKDQRQKERLSNELHISYKMIGQCNELTLLVLRLSSIAEDKEIKKELEVIASKIVYENLNEIYKCQRDIENEMSMLK